MSYRFKTTEYVLTQEEQAKAKFLIATAKHHNERLVLRRRGMSGIESDVFEEFRRRFYFDVARRLGVDSMVGWSLSDDAARAYYVSVVKAESRKKKSVA